MTVPVFEPVTIITCPSNLLSLLNIPQVTLLYILSKANSPPI